LLQRSSPGGYFTNQLHKLFFAVSDLASLHRIRFFFKLGDAYRYVCWFTNKGPDLYFGSGAKTTVDIPVTTTMEQRVIMNIPGEASPSIAAAQTKASYHASGQFHIKLGETMKGRPARWPRKSEILNPFTIAGVLTRTPEKYPFYEAIPTNKASYSIIIELAKQQERFRHYIEFMLAPAGTYHWPVPMLKLKGWATKKPMPAQIDERLFLVTRQFSLIPANNLNTYDPTFEIWLYSAEDATTED
jgi:hypothetical protein